MTTSTDVTDFDVRDCFNRQITDDVETIGVIEDLFMTNLYMLLLKTDIRVVANVIELISQQINMARLFLSRTIYKIIINCKDTFLPLLRKLTLTIVFFGIVVISHAGKLLLSFDTTYLFFIPKSGTSPLVLRC
jgi:hypothetical protein